MRRKKAARNEKNEGAAMNDLSSEILFPSDLSRLLRIHVSTVRRLAASGVIPSRRCGRRFLFSRSRIFEWLQSGGVERQIEDLDSKITMESGKPERPTTTSGGRVSEATAAQILGVIGEQK